MINYYQEKQFVALVNEADQIINQAEKWLAHKNNLLHRGFTLIMSYNDNIIFQHRNHPIFNRVFDMSFSSHQLFINHQLQTDKEAILNSLKREWRLNEEDLTRNFQFITKVRYQAYDPQSQYWENEIDYVYKLQLKHPPVFNPDFAYQITFAPQEPLAPWVQEIIKKTKLKF